jgi:6,7-dimethyl-8-ribityllumazine synthase
MSRNRPTNLDHRLPKNAKIAVIASRFNGEIVQRLLDGCLKTLTELGAGTSQVELHMVPGAFELPSAAKMVLSKRRFDGVICLGCVIRGDTPHFDFVAGECARGIQQVAIETARPVIFGVLTTNTRKQAMERSGGKHAHAGASAARACVEMILLARKLS